MIQPTSPTGKNPNAIQNPVGEQPAQQPARNASPTDLVNKVLQEALGPYLRLLSIPIPEFQYFGGTPVEEGRSSGDNAGSDKTNLRTRATDTVEQILEEDKNPKAAKLLSVIEKEGITKGEARLILEEEEDLTTERIAQIVGVDLAKFD